MCCDKNVIYQILKRLYHLISFLDIYASSSGMAHCLHLLTLLNNDFKKFTSVDNMSIEYIHDKDRDTTDAIVR